MTRFISSLCQLVQLKKSTIALLAACSSLAALINIAVVAMIANAMHQDAGPVPHAYQSVLFSLAVVAYILLQRYAGRRSVHLIEQAGTRLRQRILETVYYARTADNEQVGHHIKRSLLTRDASTAANTINALIALPAQISAAIGGLLYLFYLSVTVALMALGVAALTALVLEYTKRRSGRLLRQAHDEMDRSLAFADDLFYGHKELKLDAGLAAEFLRDDLLASDQRAAREMAQARMGQTDSGLIATALSLLLLGALVFYLRPYLTLSDSALTGAIMVLVYFQGAMSGVVQTLPTLNNAAISLQRIADFLTQHDKGSERTLATTPLDQNWQAIHLRNVSYRYPATGASTAFQLHDISLTIRRGSIVFIVGENGSGKTTLAKLLLGLYSPVHGEITLDDIRIGDTNLLAYRAQFNAVFSDVYLFRRHVHGVFRHAETAVRDSLQRMKITLRVGNDSRIDTKPYSQGQKKRLASAMTLATDNPVYLFDEWTADQDPEFRHYFYHVFLPQMRAAGKTLLVISHDDRQFHLADQVIRLRNGLLHDDQNHPNETRSHDA